ncbi:hypothetical protein JCGZ_15263 [Jatropha curcas]|uniref:Uncharacterized protein n=1 Tax=Jatropha curcas TaxID=180498 RepID=A0A067KFD1_JATCU|nr:hypothetical protein JCGZ_15263 [Jatropha curcas]
MVYCEADQDNLYAKPSKADQTELRRWTTKPIKLSFGILNRVSDGFSKLTQIPPSSDGVLRSCLDPFLD